MHPARSVSLAQGMTFSLSLLINATCHEHRENIRGGHVQSVAILRTFESERQIHIPNIIFKMEMAKALLPQPYN